MTGLKFAAASSIFGSSFLLMAIVLDSMSFAQMSWARAVIGTVTLAVVVVLLRGRLPKPGMIYLHCLGVGALLILAPHAGLGWGISQGVGSGVASVYNSITPLVTAVLAALVLRIDLLRWQQWIAIGIGCVGVLILLQPWRLEFGGSFLGQLACIAAGIAVGGGLVYARWLTRRTEVPAATLTLLYVGMAALVWVLLTPFVWSQPFELDPLVIVSVIALGVLSTGLAQVWNVDVINAWGPIAASTSTYIIPAIGLLLGTLVRQEPLSVSLVIGGLIILGSVALLRVVSRA